MSETGVVREKQVSDQGSSTDLCRRRPQKLPDIGPNHPAVRLSPLCRVWRQAPHRMPVQTEAMSWIMPWWDYMVSEKAEVV